MSKKLLVDSLATIVTKFAGRAANLLVFVVLARSLSLSEFGLYGFVATMSLLLSTALDFGTRHSIGYYYPKLEGRETQVRLQANVWIVAFSVIGSIGFGFYLYGFVSDFDTLSVVMPACLTVPGMLAIRIEQGLLLGQGRIKEYNKTEAWPRTLLLVFTGTTFLFGLITIQVALWSLALAYLLSALRVSAYNFVSVQDIRSIPWREFGETASKIIKRGLRYFPGIVLMVAAKRINFIVIQDSLGSEAMGAYYGVMRLGEVITEVALAVGVALFSHNVRHVDPAKALLETAKISRISMVFLGLISLGAIALAPWVVPLALGSNYSPFVELFRIAVLCTLAGALWNILTPVLYAAANPMLTFWLFLPGFLVNLGLTLLLVPRIGLVGAASSLLVSQILISASYLLVFKRNYGISAHQLLWIKPSEAGEMWSKAWSVAKRRILRHGRGDE